MGGGNPELLRVLQECQRRVANNQVDLPICEFMHKMSCDRQQQDTFDLIAQRWKHFSGHYLYPVPPPKNLASVTDARSIFHSTGRNLALWEGEYGDNRKALLAWAIYYLQESTSGKVVTRTPEGWVFRPAVVNEGRVEPAVTECEAMAFTVGGTPIIYKVKEP